MRKIGQKRGEKLNFGRQKGGEAVSDKFLALKYQRRIKGEFWPPEGG